MKISIIKKYGFYLLGVVLIFAVWGISANIIDNHYILPKLGIVFETLFKILKTTNTYRIIFATLLRLILIIVFCLGLAVILAFISKINKSIEEIITPIIVLCKTTPVVIFIVLLLIMVGREKAPYIITGMVVLPLIYEAIMAGINNLDKDILDEIKMISNVNFKVLLKIHLPLSWPFIKQALLQSIGLGLKVLVMAEYLALNKNSIGREISFYRDFMMYEYIYAWAIILIVLVFTIEIIIRKFKKTN